jgi:hypothetical protein
VELDIDQEMRVGLGAALLAVRDVLLAGTSHRASPGARVSEVGVRG